MDAVTCRESLRQKDGGIKECLHKSTKSSLQSTMLCGGLPLICLIMVTGILLTVRLGGVQVRHLGKAFKFMFQDEEDGYGEVTSFGALCTALSATIGTGNITGVATAIALGGPGALF